ncbi:MAG: hypothetical protein GF355_15245, partial [Candidatus Eisenbacteria bacterium]|nr:hypothetical protein [Candidatus Eisenbacteria bacterium]
MKEMQSEFLKAADRLDALCKDLTRAEKLVRKLAADETWNHPPRCRRCLDSLEEFGDESTATGFPPPDLLARARQAVDRLEHERLRTLIQELEARCRTADLPFQTVSRQNLEFRAGPLTLTVSLPKDQAQFSYAREPLGVCEAHPDAVWEALQSNLAGLTTAYGEAASFFAGLLRAYRGLLGETGRSMGGRVELADLPARLTVQRHKRAFWRNPQPRSFQPVTRA